MTNEEQVTESVSYYKYNMLLREEATNEDAFTFEGDFAKTACLMRHSVVADELNKCLEDLKKSSQNEFMQ